MVSALVLACSISPRKSSSRAAAADSLASLFLSDVLTCCSSSEDFAFDAAMASVSCAFALRKRSISADSLGSF